MIKRLVSLCIVITVFSINTIPAFSQDKTITGFLCGAGRPGIGNSNPLIIRVMTKDGKICFEYNSKTKLVGFSLDGKSKLLGLEVKVTLKNNIATRIVATGKEDTSLKKCRPCSED